VKDHRRANLYIRADAEVIERGKQYAASQGKSLSRLVEEYFLKITEAESAEIPRNEEQTAAGNQRR
jgi:hypothetical protein